MKHLCAMLCLLVLLGCGGSNPHSVITSQPAQAQAYRLTNLSAIAGPYNVVTATKGANTCYVEHIKPNTPTSGKATIVLTSNVCATVGQDTTIAHQSWATAANDGTYTIQSAVNPPTGTEFVINCSNCVQYDDETGIPPPHSNCQHDGIDYGNCSQTFDAFPVLVTDGNGLLHLVYVNGYGQQSIYPADIYERTSSDGITWSDPPTLLFHDTSGSCTAFTFSGWNCQFENVAAGVASNGNVIVFGADVTNSATSLGVFWKIWNGTTWSSASQLAGTAPDTSSWYVVYGNIHRYGSRLGVFIVSRNLNMYLMFSSDNGTTWDTAGAKLIANSSTPEGDCFSAGGNNILCVIRTASKKFLLYKSTDSGASWTNSDMGIGFSQTGTASELVAPMVTCPSQMAGDCLMTYGERTLTAGAVLWLTFDPLTLLSDATDHSIPQQLSQFALNPTDCCYSAATMLNNTAVLAWYRYPFSSYGWKMYTQTASVAVGATNTISGAVTGVVH